jgi:hypothetical protein
VLKLSSKETVRCSKALSKFLHWRYWDSVLLVNSHAM